MELVLGKKFKLEVWETIIQLMSLNEVASFTVDKSVCNSVSMCFSFSLGHRPQILSPLSFYSWLYPTLMFPKL